MKKRKVIFLFLCFFSLFFIISGPALALEIVYPKIPGFPQIQTPNEILKNPNVLPEEIFPLYVRYLYSLITLISLTIALFVFVYGGALYVASNFYPLAKPEWITQAKEKISAAFLGTLLLLSSYILFGIINPNLRILSLPKLQPQAPIAQKIIPSPEPQNISSRIDVELPFGRIIEKIFENYNSDIKIENILKKPRLKRIEEAATNDYYYASLLQKNSQELKNLSLQCKCQNANPTTSCDPLSCSPSSYNANCDCDTCKTARKSIEKIEKDNLKNLDYLKKEKEKIITETEDIKTQLKRLERTENFIKDCDFPRENSFLAYLNLKIGIENARQIKFWDDILLAYLTRDYRKDTDFATFMCNIGGTILSTPPPEQASPDTLTIPDQQKSCILEAPVGEIIDRVKKITNLLINKLEILVRLNDELAGAVDQMHILISQCNSQTPNCVSACERTISGGCIPVCKGQTCPEKEIAEQLNKINKIMEIKEEEETTEQEKNAIKNTIENKRPNQKNTNNQQEQNNNIKNEEKIGILPLVKETIPDLLKDMEITRYVMSSCERKDSGNILKKCNMAMGDIAPEPENRTIYICCEKEDFYKECLQKCYLKTNEENSSDPEQKKILNSVERLTKGEYRKCLSSCLTKKSDSAKNAGDPNWELISECKNAINFYCCQE